MKPRAVTDHLFNPGTHGEPSRFCWHDTDGAGLLCTLPREAHPDSIVLPSAPASGPTPKNPATRELKTPGPGADPMAPLKNFATRGQRAQAALDRLLVRPAPASMEPIKYPHLRAQADLLLALYLLEHPAARPTQLSVIELIAWAATKE